MAIKDELQKNLGGGGEGDTATAEPEKGNEGGQGGEGQGASQQSNSDGGQHSNEGDQNNQNGQGGEAQPSEVTQSGEGEQGGGQPKEGEHNGEGGSQQQPTKSDLQQRLENEIGEVDADKVLERVKNYDQLQKKVEDLENKDPFANDTVKQFNELVQNGADQTQIKTWFEMNSKDIDNLDTVEQRKLKLQLEDNFTEEEADAEIKENYYKSVEDEEGETKQELDKTKLSRDNKREGVLDTLKKKQADLSKPPETGADDKITDDQIQQLQQTAKQEAQNLNFDSLGDVTLIEDSENPDNNVSYNISVDESFRQQLPQLAEQFVQSTGKDLSQQQTKQEFQQFAKNIYWHQNGEQIAKNAANHAYNKAKEEAANKFQNSGKSQKGDTPPDNQSKSTLDNWFKSNEPKKTFNF